MEITDAKNELAKIKKAINGFRRSLDLDSLYETIEINEAKMTEPDFWDDPNHAQQFINDNNKLKKKYDNFQSLSSQSDDLEVNLELLEEDNDVAMVEEFEKSLDATKKHLAKYRLGMLLNGKYDSNNAILEIHPGAGGTESHDWGMMLLRMYTRWAEQSGFKLETLNYQVGEVAGIDTATLLISGENAYGYLKSEKGVHRLVRISPFDSAGRRHTSFASVDVMPELDESVNIDINPADLRIDVFRASGAGGQHVNKTSSAVRITHEPTGIVVASQAQRSQIQNRETAMNMLKSKLYEREEEKKAEQKAQIEGEQKEIGWGSQIRSYVFHPYSMVKDHRTGYETAKVQDVMDGKLDTFINSYLQWKLSKKNPN
ncbi:peptide chain release factor 2 [Apilactobacillus apisilvae]|uniref:Peptide chain release factor 2 n=1 Tax=Apilactobacillus apisilvae TaxID=2923364 RepID=A0ABY4PHX7_9LACO|nr:peptide chain release factor 2 [Apilactobacillus apisilvae]UQS85074.1 peptide chain release factor 2 [Apilactobacillus apisilvae]